MATAAALHAVYREFESHSDYHIVPDFGEAGAIYGVEGHKHGIDK